MPWNESVIDGAKSVAENKTPLNDNSAYIQATMREDHYWANSNANLDGHHKFVQMPKTESGGSPSNPTIDTDVDGVIYARDKTTTEVPDGDTIVAEPFYVVNDGSNDQYLQLGFRAMAHFEVSGGTLSAKYLHNCTVARNSTGDFTMTFTTALPSDNYVPFGMAVNASNKLVVVPKVAASKASIFTAAAFNFVTAKNNDSTTVDPTVCTIAICGG